MKRVLIAVLVVAGLAFTFILAVNLLPDWTWNALNAVRNIATGLLGAGASKVELSKYALTNQDSLKAEQVSCPSPPKDEFYTIAGLTPPDEICSKRIGDLSLNNHGIVASPLRGWVGCIDGHNLQGVHIDALTSDGNDHVASTITNTRGLFIFPSLKAGTYRLTMTSKGLPRIDAVVTSSRQSNSVLCVVTWGKAE